MASPPSIRFEGTVWSSATLTGMALESLEALHDSAPPPCTPVAMVMANHPNDIALFFALSCFQAPLILLPPDPESWPSSPPLPEGTPIVLTRSGEDLAGPAARLGLSVTVLPKLRPAEASPSAAPPMLVCPGVVAFTSGSTGLPKPVYRSAAGLLMETRAIAHALDLRPGDRVLGSLPLAGIHGLVNGLLLATILGSELELQERFDHRSLLSLFASGDIRYWAGTPFMADLLSRCPLSRPAPPAPPVCKISGGRLPETVFHAFARRFGVRVRPAYGTTENGIITADMAPTREIRPEAVGRPVPGIEVRVGDDPIEPFPPGVAGRVWFSSPWYMEGYGFPPRLEPRRERQGWWSTQDIGRLDETGYLTLLGRSDDGFKTAAGYLVNPAEISAVLTRHAEVADAVVGPIPTRSGVMIGALVEAPASLDVSGLRSFAARLLPRWCRPQIVVVTRDLPRLTTGKIDRAACLELLEREHMA